MRCDHGNFTVVRVRARGATCYVRRIRAGESLNGSVENRRDGLVEGFTVVTTSGSVWIWVGRGGRDGDRLDVSFEDGGGTGVATIQNSQDSTRYVERED